MLSLIEKKGTVWMVSDSAAAAHESPEYVALKVQKSASHYTDAALDEINLLRHARHVADECVARGEALLPHSVSYTFRQKSGPPF